MKEPSKASVELTRLLMPKPLHDLGEVAVKMAVSEELLVSWCEGTSVPSRQQAQDLERILGISESEWDFSRGKNVYFLRRGAVGPIKIGFSRRPKQRILAIQSSCAEIVELLLLLSVDSRKREREIHDRFKHLRLRGEWFRPGPDLLAWIQRQKALVGSDDLADVTEYLYGDVPFEPPNPHGL